MIGGSPSGVNRSAHTRPCTPFSSATARQEDSDRNQRGQNISAEKGGWERDQPSEGPKRREGGERTQQRDQYVEEDHGAAFEQYCQYRLDLLQEYCNHV